MKDWENNIKVQTRFVDFELETPSKNIFPIDSTEFMDYPIGSAQIAFSRLRNPVEIC